MRCGGSSGTQGEGAKVELHPSPSRNPSARSWHPKNSATFPPPPFLPLNTNQHPPPQSHPPPPPPPTMPPKRVSAPPTPSKQPPPPTATAPTTTPKPSSSLSSQTQTAHDVLLDLWRHYRSATPQRVKLVDAFMAFLVAVGALQFAYCVLAGNYVGGFFSSSVLFFSVRFLSGWVLRGYVDPELIWWARWGWGGRVCVCDQAMKWKRTLPGSYKGRKRKPN